MMMCEVCGYESAVIDTRKSKTIPNSVRRRRKCLSCGFRWATNEIAGDFAGYMYQRFKADTKEAKEGKV